MPRNVFLDDVRNPKQTGSWLAMLAAASVFGLGLLWLAYTEFCINVPVKHLAILIRKTGQDISNDDEVAPDQHHKGVQKEVLLEGRYFLKYNPWDWGWEIIPQLEIPDGKLGVRTRLHGDDLPYGEFLARKENEKGIVPGVLRPGRYAINPYLEEVKLFDPVVVPAGFRGIVTNLAGPIPTLPEQFWQDPDKTHSQMLLVKPGFRGVEKETLEPGTYYVNPYETAISLVDCRNQRFNLAVKRDMGFPSKDGFWVSLDGIIEFHVKPEMAAQVFMLYNEQANGERIDEEIVQKIILPAARSFCRIQGSNNLGRDFIQGSTRTQFQESFQTSMRAKCQPLGIESVQALITRINPPEQIAKPVRGREIAKQQELQYQQQILQQTSEEKLAVEKELVKQKQALVKAEQEVVTVTTEALREQEVAQTKASEKLAVAELKLSAAKDEAAAIASRGKAAADVVQFKNKAEAAGWQRAVEAFGGDGGQYAQYVMFQKLSAAYRQIMVNTADSPIMKIFDTFNHPQAKPAAGTKPAKTASNE